MSSSSIRCVALGTSLKTDPSPNADRIRQPARLIDLRRFGGSIVMRMTAWYAGTAFLLILVTTSFLYWALATNLDSENRRILANTATDLHFLLQASTDLNVAQHVLASSDRTFAQPQAIWVRIVTSDGQTQLETKGMDGELPISAFPAPASIKPGRDIIREIETRSGQLFQVLSTRISDQRSGTGRVLQIAMDRSDARLLLIHYRERLLLVLTISLALCSAVGYAIARSGMRPIARIIKTAEKIGSSTLHERIDAAGLPAELLSLADTFNGMLDRLQESFAQISQFSADVAHELRTPVNNLRGEIEVAMGKVRSEEEYRDVLGSALEECVRISRVIQSLLFLARAETAGESPQLERIDVRPEIAAVIEFYEPTAAEAGVRLSVEGAGELFAAFDRTLFQQAIGNLVANAIAHTPRGGHVLVQAGRDGQLLRIEVADTGRGIPAEHLPHVFTRFYRADRARSGVGDNLGLGLAVVRSIAALHGGGVTIESEVGVGTRVVLRTPLGIRRAPVRGTTSRA